MNERKIVLYIAASLDGYIATNEENLEWLFQVAGEGDNGYSEFYDTVDTILLGRVTYDWIMQHEQGNFPYEGKECYVFSRKYQEDTEHVKFVNDDIEAFVNSLQRKEGKRIWLVGGGKILQDFLEKRLIDEMILNIAPVVLGSGIPLFRESNISTQLTLKKINRFNQFVEMRYDVIK